MRIFRKRIVARLDIKGSRLIKGIRFEGLRVLEILVMPLVNIIFKGLMKFSILMQLLVFTVEIV